MKLPKKNSIRTGSCPRFLFFWNKGLALTELLVVMGIMAILFAISLISLANIERESQLSMLASEIKSAIYQAQSQTINGFPSGVYFDNYRFVLFSGTTFQEENPDNQPRELPAGLTIVNINLSSQSITFIRPTGNVSNYSPPANLTLLEAETQKSRIISINRLGTVEIN